MPDFKNASTHKSVVLLLLLSLVAFPFAFLRDIAAADLDLGNSSNYDARFDGSAASINLRIPDQRYYNYEMGDVNGDDIDDLIFTEYANDTGAYTDNGSIYIRFGNATEPSGDLGLDTASNYNLRIDGAANTHRLGFTDDKSIKIGDVNGDGDTDLIIGVDISTAGASDGGSVWVLFSTLIDDVGATTGNSWGLDTGTSYNIRYDGTVNQEIGQYGSIEIGDINDDGDDDLVIGSSLGDGWAYVMYSTLIDDVGTSTGNNQSLGTSTNYNIRFQGGDSAMTREGAMAIGDVNGNGDNDLILGSNAGGAGAWGTAHLIFDSILTTYSGTGNNVDLDTTTNYNIQFTGASGYRITMGGEVLTGDVNGDGNGDLLLGTDANGEKFWGFFSTLIDDVGTSTGNSYSLTNSSEYSFSIESASSNEDLSGFAHNYIEDVNRDGYSDLILGTDYQRVYVLFSTLLDDLGTTTGNDLDLSSTDDYNIRYNWTNAFANEGSLLVADSNGDSYADIIAGAYLADESGTNTGSIFYIDSTKIESVTGTGNNLAMSTSSNYSNRYDGDANDDRLGYRGSFTVGDFNDSGGVDLVMGAYGADNNGSLSGSIYVVFRDGAMISNLGGSYTAVLTSDNTTDAESGTFFGEEGIRLRVGTTPVSEIDTDFSDDVNKDWSGVTADVDVVTGKAVVDGLTSAPGTASTHSLLVPKLASHGSVYICPSATTLAAVTSGCAGGYERTTADSDTSIVNIGGSDYWKIDGLTGTGGLGLQAPGTAAYIDLTGQPATAPSTVAQAPELAVSTADEFYISYVPSTSEFGNTNYVDIVIPVSFSGLGTCASSTTDADGDSTADGSMAVQDSQIIRFTFTAATTTALTTGVEFCFAATSATTAGNYSIAISDTNDSDFAPALIYVGDDNDVTVTGTVPATLSLRIKEPTTTADTNTCALGVLNPGSVNSCSYRIAAGTNGSAGLEVFALADAVLDNAGATADIDDTSANTDVVAGTEGHGVQVTLGTGFTVGASFSTSLDNPMPLTETLILDAAAAVSDSNTATWSTVTHSASVDASTSADSYTQIVTYRVWADT